MDFEDVQIHLDQFSGDTVAATRGIVLLRSASHWEYPFCAGADGTDGSDRCRR